MPAKSVTWVLKPKNFRESCRAARPSGYEGNSGVHAVQADTTNPWKIQHIGASRKTALNVLSTLSAMLSTAKNWGYSAREIDLKKLVLPERNSYVAPHFTLSQVESIFNLAQEPWRTFFVVLAMTGMRAGETLGLQWADIDFNHNCIHIRRSAWCGKVQSTKSKTSSAPITLPARSPLF